MTIPTDVIMRMATLGLTEHQAKAVADMLTTVEAATADAVASGYEEKIEATREKGRRRWRTWDEKRRTNVSQRLQTTANGSQQLAGADARVEDKTSNSEIEPQEENKKRATSALLPEFEEFWSAFPNKVGKPKARASFDAARKRASRAEIMDGLRRYIASKPPDRPWLNPTTFLNQDRWADIPAVVTPMARGSPAPQPVRLADRAAQLAREIEEANHVRSSQGSSGFQQALPDLSVVSGGRG